MVKKLLSVWLSVTIVLFSTITIYAEENVEGQFLNRNIDINGNRLANYYLEDPFFLYQGSAYVPLTEEIGDCLLYTSWTDTEEHFTDLYGNDFIDCLGGFGIYTLSLIHI